LANQPHAYSNLEDRGGARSSKGRISQPAPPLVKTFEPHLPCEDIDGEPGDLKLMAGLEGFFEEIGALSPQQQQDIPHDSTASSWCRPEISSLRESKNYFIGPSGLIAPCPRWRAIIV
jgi:hypothetical protein